MPTSLPKGRNRHHINPLISTTRSSQATKRGRIAGLLRSLRISNEPTAAALAYGLEKRPPAGRSLLSRRRDGRHFPCLEVGDGVFRGSRPNGDTFLGGEDFR